MNGLGEVGRMELVLRSRKTLVGVEEVEDSFVTWDGQMRRTTKRVKVYDYVLDGAQVGVVERARELAARSGIVLRVTDVSRAGALRRAVWGLRYGGMVLPSHDGTKPKPRAGG